MSQNYLDFEEPIAVLERKIEELQSSDLLSPEKISEEILKLNESAIKLTETIYSNLSAAREGVSGSLSHPQRPHTIDYVKKLCDDFDELHGDRHLRR